MTRVPYQDASEQHPFRSEIEDLHAEARDMARAGAAGGAGQEDLRHEATFLLARLRDFENGGVDDDNARDWYGHVTPSMERLQALCISPPPAQQGSSSPPLTAERVDPGELERLSAAASPGMALAYMDKYRLRVGPEDSTYVGEFVTAAVTATCDKAGANLAYIAALWNAHRSGHLVPASLPGGTGSADEGTEFKIDYDLAETVTNGGSSAKTITGAPASPSGSQASPEAPSDLRPAGVDPSRTGLRHYPERIGVGGQLGIVDRQFGFVRCILPYDYKYTCNSQQWREARLICEALEGAMESLGVMSLTPAPCDGSGEAGETHSGSTEGDSAVPEGQAPTPDPVGEAKALLEGLDPISDPQAHADWLRTHASGFIAGGRLQTAYLAKADAIEAALATLHASQDQGGEIGCLVPDPAPATNRP